MENRKERDRLWQTWADVGGKDSALWGEGVNRIYLAENRVRDEVL
jgi:hypothetical protein